jgi:hypothetical protein
MSKVLIPIIAAGLLVCGLIALGHAARDRLRQHPQYTIAVGDIDCPAPPGLSHEEFLSEIQYLARLPNRLPALAEDTPSRLSDAFARHPWVEQVEEVRLVPPDRARVRLVLRTPALVVPQRLGRRVVDGRGFLLPMSAPGDGLPVLKAQVAPPIGLAGSEWGDPIVVAAAQLAGYLGPHRERLAVTTIEVREDVLELRCGRGRVIWGRAPGSEPEHEAPAADKLHRLLADHGPDSSPLDLRSADAPSKGR